MMPHLDARALSIASANTRLGVLDPSTIVGELAMKIEWTAFACETVALLSILAQHRWIVLILVAVLSRK
jgi:hypothetical protein